ncbi:hypothetical protein V8E51_007684 [Hyaloscypha variabilis]
MGLMTSTNECPAGTYEIDQGGGDQHCCPIGMFTGSSLDCCIDDADCTAALLAIPFCADSTWTLWNSTTANVLFCCLGDEIGLQEVSCVNDATEVASTVSAESLGKPTPVGAAAKQFSASSSTTSGAAITSLTAAATYTATTTSGGAGATTTVHKNDAGSLTPLSVNVFGSSLLGLGIALLGALGFRFLLL